MSKKRKHGGVKQQASLFERAKRELAKGNVKDALRDAKVCYREEPTAERHLLLERAYGARIEQLQRAGLQEQAQRAFEELTQLGITADDVQAKLPRLRVLLGLAEPTAAGAGGATDLWNENPELLIELADQAVFHPQRVPRKYVEIHRDCQRIRTALEAVERGDDTAAAEQLTDISRRSPFADWRLFIRGLSAFYAGESERARANWERLEPKRPAFRLAQALLVHSGLLAADQAAVNVADSLRRLEYALEDDPVRKQLKVMSEHQQEGRWSALLGVFHAFCQRFTQTHAALVERVTEMLWKRVIRKDREDQLKRLIRVAPPPTLDPHWNRAYALWSEDSCECSYERTRDYWQAYIKDVTQGSFLPPDERGIAAGLVYRRMARISVAAAHAEEVRPRFASFEPGAATAVTFRRNAIEYYQQSVAYAPQLRSAYDELAKLHLESDEDAWAVKVYQTLLKQFPDDYETHAWLANYYLEDDKPDKAEPYAREAQRLKPRDPATLGLVWAQRLAMVRLCTKKRKFAEARQEWELLRQHPLPSTDAYWLDLVRAAIEYKANNLEEAERYVAAAEAQLKDPAPVWMIMHTHAARYGLKREIKNHFGDRFKAAMEGDCYTETAGQLAKILLPFVARQIKYTGLATHKRLVLAYLQRSRRLDWSDGDLRNVVQFLTAADSWRNRALCDQLLAMGCARFPQDPLFPYLAGCAAMEHGPYHCDLLATRKLFEQALKANEAATHPLDAVMIKNAKAAVSTLDGTLERRAMYYARQLDDDDEFDDDEFDDDEFEDDDEDAFGDDIGFSGSSRAPVPFMMGVLQSAAAKMGISLAKLLERIENDELGPLDILAILELPVPESFGSGGNNKQGARR